jgi:hypothetical protein
MLNHNIGSAGVPNKGTYQNLARTNVPMSQDPKIFRHKGSMDMEIPFNNMPIGIGQVGPPMPLDNFQNMKRPNTITSSKMPKIGRQTPIEAFEQPRQPEHTNMEEHQRQIYQSYTNNEEAKVNAQNYLSMRQNAAAKGSLPQTIKKENIMFQNLKRGQSPEPAMGQQNKKAAQRMQSKFQQLVSNQPVPLMPNSQQTTIQNNELGSPQNRTLTKNIAKVRLNKIYDAKLNPIMSPGQPQPIQQRLNEMPSSQKINKQNF